MIHIPRSSRCAAVLLWLAAAIVVTITATPVARGQQEFFASPGELPKMDARTQAAVLDSVTTAIDTVYVIKDTADRIIAHLREQQAAGAYKELTDPVVLAQKLDEDARSVYDDHHFGIAAMFPVDPKAPGQVEDPRATERFQRFLKERNYGFEKVEILSGNVGYLNLTAFVDTGIAAETAVAAMNFLANTNALIIDLRQNGGGNASMIRLLTGYLFSEQKHLINWYERDTETTTQSYSLDYVPGKRLTDVPVYVLTSDRTASAAEEFTFDLKHLKRATVVGDTTSGGGHTVSEVFLHFDGFRIGMRIPYGRAFDPKTGEGWEGKGVVPDIAVSSEQALSVAHMKALKQLADAEQDEDARFKLTWAIQGMECQLEPFVLSPEQLDEYTGVYGPRTVTLESSGLYYQREGRPKMMLTPMGKDLFRVGDLEYVRFRFERDGSGKVTRIVGMYDDGNEDENDRS
jgi:retinol-binding protein 3